MTTAKNRPERATSGVLGKGQHDKLRFSGLFLPTVESDAVLDGMTLGAVMKAAGEESLWRSIRSMQSEVDAGRLTPPTRKLTQRVQSLWKDLPESPVREAAIEVLSGEWWNAAIPSEISGQWGLLKAIAAGDVPSRWACRLDHYVDVEVKCQAATALCHLGDYQAAADFASKSPELSRYLNSTSLGMLAVARSDDQSLDPNFAGFIEFTLSHVARVDVATAPAGLTEASGDIAGLLEQTFDSKVDPGRAFVQTCIRVMAVSSQAALLRLDGRADPIDERTLKRWGLGQTFPTPSSLTAFLDAVVEGQRALTSPSRDDQLLRRRLDRVQWAAQRLHVLMRLAHQPGLWAYVFREMRPDEWVQVRYRYWLDHWRGQGLAVCAHALVPGASD